MLAQAHELMERRGAGFLLTGDVVGQRNPGQTKRDMALVDFHAQVEGLVLRPLSARLLPMTLPQRQNWIDRNNLLALQGRGRKPQLALARELGWKTVPAVTAGCLLAGAAHGKRLEMLLRIVPEADEHWMTLVGIGRWQALGATALVLEARDAAECAKLERWQQEFADRGATSLLPENFRGPSRLLVGQNSHDMLEAAAQGLWRHARWPTDLQNPPLIRWRRGNFTGVLKSQGADASTPLRSPGPNHS
jgi:hypothetical protein